MGPQDLKIDSLIEKVKKGEIKEIIFALSSTMEAETTIFYLHKLFISLLQTVNRFLKFNRLFLYRKRFFIAINIQFYLILFQ